MPVERARELRTEATRQERILWRQLRLLRPTGLHVGRQVPIGPFVADFACLKHRLVIELDGGHHSTALHASRDRTRDDELAQRGFRVLRFWNTEVEQNLEGVVETILAAVEETEPGQPQVALSGDLTPVPTPALPSGEGGGGMPKKPPVPCGSA